MIPYYTVLAFAVIGALTYGMKGFLYLGALAIVGIQIFSWAAQKQQGGVVPRKMRKETATDFITSHPDLISTTYPNMSPTQAKKIIGTLLNDIFVRGLKKDPSISTIVNPYIFFLAASEIAEEQQTLPEKEMARVFVEFLRTHRLWKIRYKGVN